MMRTLVVAVLVWLLGVVVLGTTWEGRPIDATTWVDGVPLWRWGVLWALLLLAGAALASWLTDHMARALALVPLLAWFLYELHAGTLFPIAFVIYALPTIAAWGLGTALGHWRRRLRP